MKRQIFTTGDGSKTIFIPQWNEYYHSKHGAVNEAQHVFIKNGLHYLVTAFQPETVAVLEMGFGTGLNAFLTLLESQTLDYPISYVGVEAYPVPASEWQILDYASSKKPEQRALFQKLHSASWSQPVDLTPQFKLTKRQQRFEEVHDKNSFNLIYFDAFGARVQPELWTKDIFERMYAALQKEGVLVTYAAIGKVRRDMEAIGFTVERLPGPPGKRHMLRAVKL